LAGAPLPFDGRRLFCGPKIAFSAAYAVAPIGLVMARVARATFFTDRGVTFDLA
jgi:hypothetical protein